jgi:hypothetical protein
VWLQKDHSPVVILWLHKAPPAVILCLQTLHQKAEQPGPSEASG